MQRFTEVPSVDAELSILYGRLDSTFPEDAVDAVHYDAATTLDTMEQSGNEDEVESIGDLREGLLEDIQTRIITLTPSASDASFDSLDYLYTDSHHLTV